MPARLTPLRFNINTAAERTGRATLTVTLAAQFEEGGFVFLLSVLFCVFDLRVSISECSSFNWQSFVPVFSGQHRLSQRLRMLRRILPRSGALRPTPSRLLQGAVYQNVRQYSIKLDAAATTRPVDIDPSRLVIEKTKTPKPLQKPEDLVFGATFTGTYTVSPPTVHNLL